MNETAKFATWMTCAIPWLALVILTMASIPLTAIYAQILVKPLALLGFPALWLEFYAAKMLLEWSTSPSKA